MRIRQIHETEIHKLLPCLRELADHHNDVSAHFKGLYPLRPHDDTLRTFAEEMRCRSSFIAVLEEERQIVGFCKIHQEGCRGSIDYLLISKPFRNRGCGKQLMDWAMAVFQKNEITSVEVKVVNGNDAVRLYESYGFQTASLILMRTEPSHSQK